MPKFISPADPAARWTGANGGQAFFAYCDQLSDRPGERLSSWMSRLTTAVRQAEVTAAKTHDRVAPKQSFGLWPERLAGDTGYGSAENLQLAGAGARHRAAHSSVRQVQARTMASSRASDFTYDAGHDSYLCPGGKQLRMTGTRGERRHDARYRASKRGLRHLRVKLRCCPKEPGARCCVRSMKVLEMWRAISPCYRGLC